MARQPRNPRHAARRTCLAVALALVSRAAGCDPVPDASEGMPVLSLVEEMRYGSLDEPGSALSSVTGVALTDSTVLVLESDPARVAVFDRDGRWIRDIGREGDGPGELACPARIGLDGDNLWVGDPCGARLEVYGPDGASSRSYRWDISAADSLSVRSLPGAVLKDGSILAIPRDVLSRRPMTRPYFRATTEGDGAALLYRGADSPRDPFSGSLPGGGYVYGHHPLAVSPVVAVFPDGSGLVVVDGLDVADPDHATFEIRILDPSGGIETDVSVPYAPVPADGWLQRWVDDNEIDAETAAVFEDVLSERAFYPPVTEAVGGIDGSVWIRRETPLGDSATWQVFRRTGEPAGALSTPADLRILLPSLEEVWAVERSELDVPFVVQMRVVSP